MKRPYAGIRDGMHSGSPIHKKVRNADSSVFIPAVDQYVSLAELNRILADDTMPNRNMTKRNIAACKRVDFDWFTQHELCFAEMFERLTWRSFCEYDGISSISKVKEFYANITFHKEDSLIKFIKVLVDEKTFVFSVFDVCRLFESDLVNNLRVISEGKLKAYQTINDGEVVAVSGYLQNTGLSFSNRMFHKAVMSCLAPRIGSIDTVMPRDWNLMVHLKRGIPVNLGSVIFGHMASCVQDENRALPFAHVITALLQFYGEQIVPVNQMDTWSTQVIGANSVASMGYQYVDGVFVKKPTKRQIAASVRGKSTADLGKQRYAERERAASSSKDESLSSSKLQKVFYEELSYTRRSILERLDGFAERLTRLENMVQTLLDNAED
ncbi:hypothetical protein MLD38_026761 [Melastoma candidum]|uniref:Uncharacterized protein n=1 Tax=Melastoma candidum TaxID=119954 RepID=A0ACB9NZF9_9MYRT|nr:hypothetical protein MLD38_026761 [Melastoma candidum]